MLSNVALRKFRDEWPTKMCQANDLERVAAAIKIADGRTRLSGHPPGGGHAFVHGQMTKRIAAKLGLSEITVKVCRARLMKKMVPHL